MNTARLQGGPFDGKVMIIGRGDRIVCAYAPVLPVAEIELPPWRWWDRLLRRPAPLPPDPPMFKNALYRATTIVVDGAVIYRYAGDE